MKHNTGSPDPRLPRAPHPRPANAGRCLHLGLLLLTGLTAHLLAQSSGQSGQSTGQPSQTSSGSNTSGSGSSSSTTVSVPQGQQQLNTAAGTNGATPTSDSYRGSVVEGKSTGQNLDLLLSDAIDRGLRTNLGIILQSSTVTNANGLRLEQLQSLLPTLTGSASIEVEQVNTASFGIKFPGVKTIVGPFQVVDFRAYLTQNVLNLQALQSYLAARHNFQSAKLTAEDARDMVVLTVGNAYLLCIADQARIEAVEAELATAKVTLDQAVAGHDAGISPRIDVLRAQVDFQNEQQNLISTTNQLSKDKIALARTIGLPLDQPFTPTDRVPFQALAAIDPQQAFEQALKTRKDIAAAQQTVRAGEADKKSAFDSQLPVAKISGDFGDLGTTPGHSHGTYTATGEVTAPILQIAQTRGAEAIAGAELESARARLSDQAQQVNADIRDNLLDIQAAAKLVDAARSNLDLANEALAEAQLRFRAGVSDNLPVSQAQSQTEQANDQFISALYQHNVAKLSLARALGVAVTSYKDYLGGK